MSVMSGWRRESASFDVAGGETRYYPPEPPMRSLRPDPRHSLTLDEEAAMPTRFLIEVPHEGTYAACMKAVDVFLKSGSHFLSRADWGCKDGEHKAWIGVEGENKGEARHIVPPAFRAQAKIIQLNSFTLADLDGLMRGHEA